VDGARWDVETLQHELLQAKKTISAWRRGGVAEDVGLTMCVCAARLQDEQKVMSTALQRTEDELRRKSKQLGDTLKPQVRFVRRSGSISAFARWLISEAGRRHRMPVPPQRPTRGTLCAAVVVV
jgi:hypothetical protein